MLLDYKKAAAQAVAVSNELKDARSELEKFTSINDDIIKRSKKSLAIPSMLMIQVP